LFRIAQFLARRQGHQAPELRGGVGQGLGTATSDAVPKGDDPGQRVLALPADLGALDRGAAAEPPEPVLRCCASWCRAG